MKTAQELSSIAKEYNKQDFISLVVCSYIMNHAKKAAKQGLYHCYYVMKELYEDRVDEIKDILNGLGYTVVLMEDLGFYITWDNRKPDHVRLSTDSL